ncbi:MAG TPA: hypothetical protein VMI92_01000 [Steroidobacteraceae bacterium]|nr:hypothetical protein [Steroidobacteraceae bacterium]
MKALWLAALAAGMAPLVLGANAPDPFGGRAPNGSYLKPAGSGTKTDPKSLPDFAGVWVRAEGLTHPDQSKILPFMTDEAAADWKRKIAAHDFRVPWSFCEPTAVPAMMTEFGLPIEVLMTAGRVTLLAPDGQIRSIYTDGSTHPEASLNGTYFGNSIGHWEGATLVVETTDLRPENDVVMGLPAGTDNMKVMERLTLVDKDRLRDELEVTGPKYLKAPYRYTQFFTRRRDLRLAEFVCLPESNRNTGNAVDLTPPKD